MKFGYTQFMVESIKPPEDQNRTRKDDHIRINIEEDVQSHSEGGFDLYYFEHNAMPEIDFKEVDTSTSIFQKSIRAPLLISSMTGGTKKGIEINRRLACAAENFGIAMGVGSQRVDIEAGFFSEESNIRNFAPNIPVFANIGAIQLNYGMTISNCRKAIDLIRADALIFHLNPLQEVLQPEGQTNFAGLLKKIKNICKELQIPVIVKEVGWGISSTLAGKLIDAGVSCIDVAGAGGTSWALVEKFRNQDPIRVKMSDNFKDWGIPTAFCLEEIHTKYPHFPLISSGGLRNGIDAAKSIALGAVMAGFAGPLLRAAVVSQEKLNLLLARIIDELKVVMFVTGAKDIPKLSKIPLRYPRYF
jgi:isopentenyl-diphosphate delta-isomerase